MTTKKPLRRTNIPLTSCILPTPPSLPLWFPEPWVLGPLELLMASVTQYRVTQAPPPGGFRVQESGPGSPGSGAVLCSFPFRLAGTSWSFRTWDVTQDSNLFRVIKAQASASLLPEACLSLSPIAPWPSGCQVWGPGGRHCQVVRLLADFVLGSPGVCPPILG